MSPRMKKALNYTISAIVTVTLAYVVFVPVAPPRIEYTTLSSNQPVPGTTYLKTATVTIGASADIVPVGIVAKGTPPLVAATVDYGSTGAWTVKSADASITVTVDGKPAQGVALADGSVITVGGAKMTFGAGRAGLLGFLDRIESNPTSHIFMSPAIIARAFPVVAKAFPVSVLFGVLGFLFAIPMGLALAFMKMARTRWFRFPATLYVDVVRGTPLFLQILIFMFAFPLLPVYQSMMQAWPWLSDPGPFNTQYTFWMRGLVVLSFNSAAYMAEIFRAGIQSISKGQSEAARSLGMTGVQSMAFVILPQTVRRILPTMMSEFILLFKDTAMLSAVGVAEMVLRAREVAATALNTSSYLVAAGFYLLLTIPLGRFVQSLENRLAISEGAGGAAAVKPESVIPVPIDSDHVIAQSESNMKMQQDANVHRRNQGR